MSSNDQDPNDTPEEPPKRPEWTPGRRLSRKGMSRARGEDLNAHAKVEARRKATRRAAGTTSPARLCTRSSTPSRRGPRLPYPKRF